MAAGLVIPQGSLLPFADILRPFKSAATLAANDLVNLNSTGELDVAGAGERIAGVVQEAATSSSTDVQVNITPFLTVVMDSDTSGTLAVGDVGAAFDLAAGGTGAQIIATSTKVDLTATTNSAQLVCLAFNPQDIRDDLDSDTSVGLFMIREHQFSNV